MSNSGQRSRTAGTHALQAAIARSQKPLDLVTGNKDAEKAAKIREEASQYPWGIPNAERRKHWTQQARFRYYGKETAKRKGTIRNNVEDRLINRIGRKR